MRDAVIADWRWLPHGQPCVTACPRLVLLRAVARPSRTAAARRSQEADALATTRPARQTRHEIRGAVVNRSTSYPAVQNAGFLLDGLLWCGKCQRQMIPVSDVDGTRAYSCGYACPQANIAAVELEQDLLLRALVRAYTALHGVGRRADSNETVSQPWRLGGRLTVSASEMRRWQQCNPANRRAMLRTAFYRVIVAAEGVEPCWRHEADNRRMSRQDGVGS